MGRVLCGLPVFSWPDGKYRGSVLDFYIDGEEKNVSAVVIKNGNRRKKQLIRRTEILKLYKDGVIISAAARNQSLKAERDISYRRLIASARIVCDRGEVVADVVFNEKLELCGYEISNGVFGDLLRGRSYRPRNKKSIQNNGR